MKLSGALSVAFIIAIAGSHPVALSQSGEEFFEARIRPVLVKNCLSCHTNAPMGGLKLDSRQNLLKGGDSGPAIVVGDPDKSLLIQVVRHTHERLKMPFGREKLKNEEIADLAAWVKSGAAWPGVSTGCRLNAGTATTSSHPNNGHSGRSGRFKSRHCLRSRIGAGPSLPLISSSFQSWKSVDLCRRGLPTSAS